MRRLAAFFVLLLAVSLAAPPPVRAQLQPVTPEVVKRIAGAAGEALKSGKLATKSLRFEPVEEKAFGYRIGAAAVVIIPSAFLAGRATAAGQEPLPLALVITQGFTLGDFRMALPLNQALTLAVPEGAPDLKAFFVALRRVDSGRSLAVYGAAAEPLLSVPVRILNRASDAPIALSILSDRAAELAFTVSGSLAGSLRLVPPPAPEPSGGAGVSSPQPGDPAPDFSLKEKDGRTPVQLGSFKGQRPVVLVFGSYSSPTARAQSGVLNTLYEKYKDRAAFLFIYLREAYPAGARQVPANTADGILVQEPKSLEERQQLAATCAAKLGLPFPVLVDDMDNSVARAYAAWPDRLCVVDREGKIALQTRSSSGSPLQELARWLSDHLARPAGSQ
jgi:Iodothyronine deiodinase